MNPRGRPRTAPERRFWTFVRKLDNGCWQWTGGHLAFGYGMFWDGDRRVKAHRWSYEHFVAPIPDGLVIDHLCRNPACVNPSHMEAVTLAENTLRGTAPSALNARKEACPQGHPYELASGQRICRTCRRRDWARYRAKKRAAA